MGLCPSPRFIGTLKSSRAQLPEVEFFLYDIHLSSDSFYIILSCVTRTHITLSIKQVTAVPVSQGCAEGVSVCGGIADTLKIYMKMSQ